MSESKARARVKVFVPTFRRPEPLRRSLISLINQSFTDWCCEVHNDDPEDGRPSKVVLDLADKSIKFVHHERNLGATRTFNLFFKRQEEPFISILEDDNWWESGFLQVMITQIEQFPDVSLAWCNQRIYEEMSDGSWRDTERSVNPFSESKSSILLHFGDPRQIMGACHANGAALFRSRYAINWKTPDDLPFNAVEAFRERLISFPILYVPFPMAVFAKTLQTARSDKQAEWLEMQVMLATTFLKHANYEQEKFDNLLSLAAVKFPPSTSPFLLSTLIEPKLLKFLSSGELRDWLRLFKTTVGSPDAIWTVLRSKWRHPEWWDKLDTATRKRFCEASNRPICG